MVCCSYVCIPGDVSPTLRREGAGTDMYNTFTLSITRGTFHDGTLPCLTRLVCTFGVHLKLWSGDLNDILFVNSPIFPHNIRILSNYSCGFPFFLKNFPTIINSAVAVRCIVPILKFPQAVLAVTSISLISTSQPYSIR